MLNLDVKLFAKILAQRLQKGILNLIGWEKTGFMPGRQALDSIRCVLHLSHSFHRETVPGFLLSLNIHKAFDSLAWPYLRILLSHWGFGPNFLQWVWARYIRPKVFVQYEGFCSDLFPVSWGTRQGCPLLLSCSPWLLNRWPRQLERMMTYTA